MKNKENKENNMNENNNKANEVVKIYYVKPATRFENGKEVLANRMEEGTSYVQRKDIPAFIARQEERLARFGASREFKLFKITPSDIEFGEDNPAMAGYVRMFGTASE